MRVSFALRGWCGEIGFAAGDARVARSQKHSFLLHVHVGSRAFKGS